MMTHPPMLHQAARNLLNNPDLSMMFTHRLAEINEDILQSEDATMVLDAHKEYNAIRAFADFITQLGNQETT